MALMMYRTNNRVLYYGLMNRAAPFPFMYEPCTTIHAYTYLPQSIKFHSNKFLFLGSYFPNRIPKYFVISYLY